MSYHKKARKFGRTYDVRKAFLKSLAGNLILNGSIKTTVARAKEIRSLVERLITRAKNGDLVAKRYAAKYISDNAVTKLCKIAPAYKDRNGGYTRIIKIGARKSDGAFMVKIELI